MARTQLARLPDGRYEDPVDNMVHLWDNGREKWVHLRDLARILQNPRARPLCALNAYEVAKVLVWYDEAGLYDIDGEGQVAPEAPPEAPPMLQRRFGMRRN